MGRVRSLPVNVAEVLIECENAAHAGFSRVRLAWEPTPEDLAELSSVGMWAVGVSVDLGDGRRTEVCHVSWEAGVAPAAG